MAASNGSAILAEGHYIGRVSDVPFELIGGAPVVHAITEAFYDRMREAEPKLADLHVCDADGRIADEPRRKFELFLVEWLGGPKNFSAAHGHPRLRMRHARFPVDDDMIRAWLACMMHALDQQPIQPEVRAFLDMRLTDLANFMKNR